MVLGQALIITVGYLNAAVAPAERVKLYVYAEGNLRNASFLPILMNWTERAKECGYDGMFYADSDFQTLHLGPPASESGCEWCGLGTAEGFLSSAKRWLAQAQSLDFGLFPLVFPFGPSDPILLQPEPTEASHRSSVHNLVEPIAFSGTEFRVDHAGRNLALVDSMERALQNPSFDPPPAGDEFAHWLQDKPGKRTFVDRVIKRGARGASLRVGPGAGDGMAMQRLVVPTLYNNHQSVTLSLPPSSLSLSLSLSLSPIASRGSGWEATYASIRSVSTTPTPSAA
eukprot:COSAG02_NODE_560_length_20328_cov_15.507343_14_plen_284_part_00